METDIERLKKEHEELHELLDAQEGKYVSQKFIHECWSKTRAIELLMMRVDPKVIEKLERLRLSEEGEWQFSLKRGDKGLELHAEDGRVVILTEASNHIHIKQEKW